MGAYNGSGVFVRSYLWANDKINNIKITASRVDTEDNGFASGLSSAIVKDGQQICTAQIPFAIGISIPAGTVGAPGVAVIGDLTTGLYQSASGALDVASTGVRVGGFTTTGLNNTVIGATTKAAGSFTTLVGTSSTTLGANGGTIGSVVLNGSTSGATTIIPNVAASGTLMLPAATDTLVGKATTDILTNKTLTAPTMTAPVLGTPASGTLTNCTGLPTTALTGTVTGAQLNGLSALTNSLSGDVTLNNTAVYFDGPSIAQGTSGKWFASGTVVILDTSAAAAIDAKLWDGTTLIASANGQTASANASVCLSLSGFISAPAGNLRISVKDTSSTSGLIKFNNSGLSMDSTITAFRIG